MATENVRVIKIDTNPAQTSVKDLKAELKDLKNTMLSCEEGTDSYNKALVRAAEIQHELKEQMEEINGSAMDFGQIASNCTNAVGGMVAGFQAATAVMNLFGVENENVIKSMQKMQQLMALSQALPALDKAFKAFKRLSTAISTAAGATSKWGKALVSTGIGAIVVLLGYLIANFDEISKWLDELTGQTDFLGEVSDKVVGGLHAAWAGLVQTLKAVGNAIITYVTTPVKAVWNAIQAFTSTNGDFLTKLKAAGNAMKNGFVSDWKNVGNDFKEIGTVAADAYQSGYQKNKKRRAEKNKQEAIAEGRAEGTAKGKARAQAQVKAQAAAEKEEEKAYKKRLNRIDAQERAEILALQKLGLGYEEYVAKKQELEDKFTKNRIEALQNILNTEKNLTADEIANLQDELIKLQDSLYKKPEPVKVEKTEEKTETEADTAISTAKGISEAINASAAALSDFSNNPAWGNILKNVATLSANWDSLYEDMKKVNSDIPEEARKAYSAYSQIAAAGLGAVANLLNGLASEQDTSNEEGFESAKKYQMAGASMSMLAGIASAWASSMQLPFPVNLAVGAALSAMMLGTGIMQIQKIKNTKFDGEGVSGSASSPNANAVSSVIAPVQYTQDIQGASIEGAIKDSKVYVTETDITNTQNKVHVSESEARF